MTSTSLDDFEIQKTLGKGTFGSVYLVTRKKDNKIYAIKSVILEKLSKKQQENSLNEVRILASINHQNVIGYKEAFWDEKTNSLNIVMEYADDGDLQTKINKMKNENAFFNESLIWHYAIQMIKGLKALHDKKIMHRDLKSANIFLIKNKFQCKIGDMNVSKVLKEKLLRTQTGTPYYASPEVWLDKPYSYKSDLWSIGCVIYELCELKTPFKGDNIDDLFINICRGKLERINKVYSDDLWKMINMLLQVDVDRRVDCNQFLNCELIKKKMEELQKIEEFNDINIFENQLNYEEGDELLDTIKFKDIKDIKTLLPNKKNYDSSTEQSFNNNNFMTFSGDKNFDKNNNNINNINVDNCENDIEKKENKNKVLIKELRKELEDMKYKEEIRKKEKKENLEKKLKNEKINKEKNIIKEKIKQSERKLKEEKSKKISDTKALDIKNYKNSKKNNNIAIPFNTKKVKYVKRNQIKYLYKNNSKLSILASTKTNSIKNNDINDYYNKNQNTVRNNENWNIKNNIFNLEMNLLTSSYNKNIKSLSFSHNKRYLKETCPSLQYNINSKHLSMLNINRNNKINDKNNKSNINDNENQINKINNLMNLITSINLEDNSIYKNTSNFNFNNSSRLNENNIYDLKKNNFNSNCNCDCNSNIRGVNSTPDFEYLSRITKLINSKKKSEDNDIYINFIPNNYHTYLNNNRYELDSISLFKNKIINNNNPNIKMRNNNKIINTSCIKKTYPKKSKSFFSQFKNEKSEDKISIDNNDDINIYKKKNSSNNLKINIPIKGIKTNVQRKYTETNLEKNLAKYQNKLIRNKMEYLEKYELNKPKTIAYESINFNNEKENRNIFVNSKSNNSRKYNNSNGKGKNSFLNNVKKENMNKILREIKSNRGNNNYYKYQAQKYPIPKFKSSINSLNIVNGSCLNIPIKPTYFYDN